MLPAKVVLPFGVAAPAAGFRGAVSESAVAGTTTSA